VSVEQGIAGGTPDSPAAFVAMAHLSASIQPGSLFMFHGWDPMLFPGRRNFSSAIPTAGLLKPTSLVGGYGHIAYNALDYVPNQTFNDCTVDFEKYLPVA
jgi:nitrate reductase alpha subunit